MDRREEIEIRDCVECAWSVHADEHDAAGLSRLVIDHAVETGHDIETRFVRPHVW
jgi:hypothetical protein